MSGFVLGTDAGATLGQASGGTLGTAPDTYLLDNRALPSFTAEVATHRRLTLGFRVTTDTLLAACRRAKTDENQIDVHTTDDGGFTAVDRAGGANTFTLTPPAARQPLRTAGTYHVARYEESLVSQTVEEWQVEIEFVRDTDREDTALIDPADQGLDVGGDAGGTLGESTGFTLGGASGATLGNQRAGVPADHWALETRYGTVGTDRVDAAFIGTGADGVERFELTARLTFRQAYTLETALSRLDGTRVRNVVDATNVAVDDTDGDANTLTVTSPTEDVVASGEYVVIEPFESRRLNDAYQEISLTIAKAG